MTHHLSNRVEYFKELKEILKSDGKVIVIEYNGRGGFSFHKIYGHFIPQQTIINEMKEAGYRTYKSYDFLSEQSFNIFHV